MEIISTFYSYIRKIRNIEHCAIYSSLLLIYAAICNILQFHCSTTCIFFKLRSKQKRNIFYLYIYHTRVSCFTYVTLLQHEFYIGYKHTVSACFFPVEVSDILYIYIFLCGGRSKGGAFIINVHEVKAVDRNWKNIFVWKFYLLVI